METVNVAWAPSLATKDENKWLRLGTSAAYAVLREREWRQQREMIIADVVAMLDASVVRAYEPRSDGELRLGGGEAGSELPPDAELMERELLLRALSSDKSMISNHPLLDPQLRPLAERCRRQAILTHVMLVRAYGRNHGAFAVHWIGRERPPFERRAGFYGYWDTIGLAVAAAQERARIESELNGLRARALLDRLTGLPNGFALDEQLRHHDDQGAALSVLALDFDGMREANAAFKSYELGGDILIKAVGQTLRGLARKGEFPARLHSAGDEFALLLGEVGEEAARRRAREVEAQLDALEVPESHRAVYHGASVGCATRRGDETPGHVLGRAIEAMHERKLTRRATRDGQQKPTTT